MFKQLACPRRLVWDRDLLSAGAFCTTTGRSLSRLGVRASVIMALNESSLRSAVGVREIRPVK